MSRICVARCSRSIDDEGEDESRDEYEDEMEEVEDWREGRAAIGPEM